MYPLRGRLLALKGLYIVAQGQRSATLGQENTTAEDSLKGIYT